MKKGDNVKINGGRDLFNGCEGYIIQECRDGSFLVHLVKGNDRITEEEMLWYDVYFEENELELM